MERINGQTELVALFADPAKHSISPLMHNLAYQLLDLPLVYLCFEVNKHNLAEAMKSVRQLQFRGLNLSMPNKEAVLPYLDELSPEARLIGAANTVRNQNGRLIGYNTDGKGTCLSLAAEGFDITGKTVTLMGTGGAGRAMAIQLALDGVEKVSLFNRRYLPNGQENPRFQETLDLAALINAQTPAQAQVGDLSDSKALSQAIQESHLLLNGTKVGMDNLEKESPVKDPRAFHPNLFVFDAIYHPRETLLLRQAKQAGVAKTINGLGMLLYQGAEAFRIHTGKDMPIKQVKEAVFGQN